MLTKDMIDTYERITGLKYNDNMLEKFLEYKKSADTFAEYESADYPYTLLVSEIGEVFGKFAKIERGDPTTKTDNFRFEIAKEIGDVFWSLSQLYNVNTVFEKIDASKYDSIPEILVYLNDFAGEIYKDYTLCKIPLKATKIMYLLIELCNRLGFTFEFVLSLNIEKLTDRKNRGVIKGSGDNR